MSNFQFDNAPPNADQAAFNDYMGSGVVHVPPPKRMKCNPVDRNSKKNPEEADPVSVDVFMSQESQSSSNGGYETASEETPCKKKQKKVVEEEEEEEEDLVMDSQDSKQDVFNYGGSPELGMDYDDDIDLNKTIMIEMPRREGPDGAVHEEMELEDVLKVVDDIIEQDQSETPPEELRSPQTMETELMDEDILITSSASASNQTLKVEQSKEEGEDEEATSGSTIGNSADDLQHLQLGGSLEKRIRSADKRRTEKDERAKENLTPEKVSDGFDQSGPLNADMLVRKAEKKSSEQTEQSIPAFLQISPARSTRGNEMLSYDGYLNRMYEGTFVTEKRSFRPDFRGSNYNQRNHHIYCEIPGYSPENVDPAPVEGRILKLLPQPWRAPVVKYPMSDEDEKLHMRYKQQRALLRNYLKMFNSGGYQLFVGLIESMWGADDLITLDALERYFLEESARHGESSVLYKFACVVSWALDAESCLPDKIYRLTDNIESATFSQKQCACILAWLFFVSPFEEGTVRGSYETRSTRTTKNRGFTKDKGFAAILRGGHKLCVEKLRFLFNYFADARESPQGGTVSFRKVRWLNRNVEAMLNVRNKLNVTIVSPDLKIEQTAVCTQVDFANKRIGGGVLRMGSVQEEIRFLMCPEMIISMLLCDEMKDNEAVSIVGAQAFSSYSGYGHTLKWEPLTEKDARQNNVSRRDHYGRLCVETIAIDAKSFGHLSDSSSFREQFNSISREYFKALCGFSSQGDRFPLPIVSGWWGCGAFGGNKPLKFLIQACAAARVGRPLWICTFGDEDMARKATKVIDIISRAGLTAGIVMHELTVMRPPSQPSETYVFDVLATRIRGRLQQRNAQIPASIVSPTASRPSTSSSSEQNRAAERGHSEKKAI